MSEPQVPPGVPTSSTPILHCCDTWHSLAQQGRLLANQPEQTETKTAIGWLQDELLHPLEDEFGLVLLTYGFAGRELIEAVRARAATAGRAPGIAPELDQHSGYEVDAHGARICDRDGIAVDLRVPGRATGAVRDWIVRRLGFDRIYFYGDDRPLHLSWAPEPTGQVVEMLPSAGGRVVPRVIVPGRAG
jgi:hypothetical protein